MTPREELELRKRQLEAREGKVGFNANAADIRARIAELKQLIAGGE